MFYEHYEFQLQPLPYATNALLPFIDEQTMILHHDFHLKTYVENLNKLLSPMPRYWNWSLEKILLHINSFPKSSQTAINNNAGGVFNHQFYFNNLAIDGLKTPTGKLAKRIDRDFGSFETFKAEFKKNALGVFGSGYTWLVCNNRGKLSIINTANQNTPIPMRLTPLVSIDVWEHAYYLKHYNKRAAYIDDWFNVVNFQHAVETYENQY